MRWSSIFTIDGIPQIINLVFQPLAGFLRSKLVETVSTVIIPNCWRLVRQQWHHCHKTFCLKHHGTNAGQHIISHHIMAMTTRKARISPENQNKNSEKIFVETETRAKQEEKSDRILLKVVHSFGFVKYLILYVELFVSNVIRFSCTTFTLRLMWCHVYADLQSIGISYTYLPEKPFIVIAIVIHFSIDT